jgi:dephospho-CoA kinase
VYAVAITGGIASGKTAVTDRLTELGVTVVDADLASRAVVEPGQPALAEITAAFGVDTLAADGRLDRAALRRRIVADADARRRLEAILHPRIRSWMLAHARQADSDYVALAIPLLVETGGRANYDWVREIVVVDTPQALQRQRLQARDGADSAQVEGLLAAQASRAQRLALADHILINDAGLAELRRAVDRLHPRLCRHARQSPG